jgi:hypothetical protein
MNVFNFHNKVKSENNNQVNLINSCDKGFYITTLNGRMDINEMRTKSERKFYETLEDAQKSEQLKKYASFPTYNVVMHGTDFANAELITL